VPEKGYMEFVEWAFYCCKLVCDLSAEVLLSLSSEVAWLTTCPGKEKKKIATKSSRQINHLEDKGRDQMMMDWGRTCVPSLSFPFIGGKQTAVAASFFFL